MPWLKWIGGLFAGLLAAVGLGKLFAGRREPLHRGETFRRQKDQRDADRADMIERDSIERDELRARVEAAEAETAAALALADEARAAGARAGEDENALSDAELVAAIDAELDADSGG